MFSITVSYFRYIILYINDYSPKDCQSFLKKLLVFLLHFLVDLPGFDTQLSNVEIQETWDSQHNPNSNGMIFKTDSKGRKLIREGCYLYLSFFALLIFRCILFVVNKIMKYGCLENIIQFAVVYNYSFTFSFHQRQVTKGIPLSDKYYLLQIRVIL